MTPVSWATLIENSVQFAGGVNMALKQYLHHLPKLWLTNWMRFWQVIMCKVFIMFQHHYCPQAIKCFHFFLLINN